jgi:hypothetical protein
MNLYQSGNIRVLIIVNDALSIALATGNYLITIDDKAVIFGEDVGFGGVFRCTVLYNLNTDGTTRKIWKVKSFQFAPNRARNCRVCHRNGFLLLISYRHLLVINKCKLRSYAYS